MSNRTVFLTVKNDWDSQGTLDYDTVEFSLGLLTPEQYKSVLHPGGCGMVIALESGSDERDGIYLGDVVDFDVYANLFLVELM